MKLEIKKGRLEIIAETDQDVSFIEDTLGMKNIGDSIPLVRSNYASALERLTLKTETSIKPTTLPSEFPYQPVVWNPDKEQFETYNGETWEVITKHQKF